MFITALLEETGLQRAKCMTTPAVRPTAQKEVKAEQLQSEEATRYRSCLGKLMYLANDHPDVEYAVNCLARRASKPTHLDEQRLKRVVRYLRGHPTARWEFVAATADPPPTLIVYTDADWGRRHLDAQEHQWRHHDLGRSDDGNMGKASTSCVAVIG